MTYKLQAQAGSRRRSCGVTPRTISGMPSSTERDAVGRLHILCPGSAVNEEHLVGRGIWLIGPCRPHIIRHPTTLATMVTRASEKEARLRPRQIFRCAPRSVRHHERPLPWKASRLRDPSAGFWQDVPMGHRSGGSESNRQGTLTITGSNVRLGTEMPVALSRFFI